MRLIVLIIIGLTIICSEVIDASSGNGIFSNCVNYDDDDDDDGDDHKHPREKHSIVKQKGKTHSNKAHDTCQNTQAHAYHYYLAAQRIEEIPALKATTLLLPFTWEDHDFVNFDIVNLIYEPPKFMNR